MVPVAAIVAGVVAVQRALSTSGPVVAACRVMDGTTPFTLALDQTANATTIAAVGKAMGLPDHAVTIALATAFQESRLHNLAHGDLDSLGLFQQRPSQGWGTPAQIMTPTYAAADLLHPPGQGAQLGDPPGDRSGAAGPAQRRA